MLRSALLYTALLFGANAALAGPVDWQAAREAGLVKLVPSESPAPVSDVEFTDPNGGTRRLADYRGKVVLLNFWATWCAPCRKEMPYLDALQAEMGGEDFEVVAVATGRNTPEKIDKFYEETGLKNLPVLLDPRQQLARAMGVVGLPVTVLIDRDGNEVARLLGEADWSSEPAKAVIRQMMAE
ncbi:TlpA family protein disulfide reductase [Paracoccus sediminis]|uniref:Thiol-disulfide isomerase or thioredoxin n=1 Tax=Paracoccus sediminis TaxID=1214787 RepID=A0A238VYV9_9RHOB|nr:TlpA disulfide reductase family protein [Paracoccus sediminis]TBN51397.1 TlpA family protein disulfide reductase [Paracoccus sediminis]SNR39063.1 Thiol-disulfide isomerase or thioredoxin [Paracoccus sediminis]